MKLVVVLVVLFIFFTRSASAALLTFTDKGEVYWNVLGLEDSILEVKKVADKVISGSPVSISLTNNSGKVSLSYGEGKTIDVSDYGEDIVQVEGRENAKKLAIKATENGFAIHEKSVIAETQYPISINSPENKISVKTPTGERFLSVSPFDAVSMMIRTKTISPYTGDKTIKLTEREGGDVLYTIDAVKEIKLLNVISIEVPVVSHVSAISGNVIDVETPLWYSVVDFLLV